MIFIRSFPLFLSLSHFFFLPLFPLLSRPKLVIESDLDRTLEASFELRAVIEKAHYEMRSLKFREKLSFADRRLDGILDKTKGKK